MNASDAGHQRKRVRSDRAGCKVGLKQCALDDIEPPCGIGRRIIGAALAEMAMPIAQDAGADFFHASSPSPLDLTDGKSIQRDVTIGLPGIEPRRWKIRTVWRVGIDLRFQAERVILAVNAAILAGHGPVEKIAGIELDAGLVGPEFENPARLWIFHAGGKARLGGRAAGQTVIVIVALPDLNLFVRIAQAGADRMGFAKIKRRCIDLAGRAQRNAGGADRQIGSPPRSSDDDRARRRRTRRRRD